MSSRLARFSVATTVATFALILLGGYVKAIGAGLACPDWPTCYGRWLPPFEGAAFTPHMIMAEWTHRLLASLVGPLIIANAVLVWRAAPRDRSTGVLAGLAAALLPVQVVLGGLTVTELLQPLLVVAHLALATIIFGLLVATTVRLHGGVAASAEAAEARAAEGERPRVDVRDYVAMVKPRILLLLVATALVAMLVAGGPGLTPLVVLATLAGGALAAGSANVLNMVLERDLDARMRRTAHRPLPAGRVTPARAVLFACLLATAATVMLAALVNVLAAALALAGVGFYILVYTLLLKRTTPQNIVIGGAAGGFPALVGWAAVTGEVTAPAVLLGLLIVLWTPPHFWALALVCKDDYARAGIPMLPVVAGDESTRRQIVFYALLTVGATILFTYPMQVFGGLYLAAAVLLGAVFLWLAVELTRSRSLPAARRLFVYSIAYLWLLYAAMLVDRYGPLS